MKQPKKYVQEKNKKEIIYKKIKNLRTMEWNH